MAAGGFRTFIPGEVLDEDKINDFLMQGILVFADAAARDVAITAPVEGQFVFLKDSDSVEFFDGSDFVALETGGIEFSSVVIAGAGGGGRGDASGGFQMGGGAGAGGYFAHVASENSGGGISSTGLTVYQSGESFTVTVGAGGAGTTANNQDGTRGGFSAFGPIVVEGGGFGAKAGSPGSFGASGGAAGGGASAAGPRISGQGFNSGTGGNNFTAAGGGGAGGVGGNSIASPETGGAGGAGVSSSITGSSVGRAGGGGGGATNVQGVGTDGGGSGALQNTSVPATAGTVNTGGGGGGGSALFNGAAGGSGVVILRYPSSITLTIGAGLTSSTATDGNFKVTSFTAGTDTVTVP